MVNFSHRVDQGIGNKAAIQSLANDNFLKRFEIGDPLPTLAAAMNTTQNTLVISLESFMKVRHECAHTGFAKIMPTTTDVQGYCDLIEQLGTGIVTVFQDTLGKPPYVVPPPAVQVGP
jgi:hypothetical protein